MKTLDPLLLSAETDKLSAIPNGLNALQNHVRNRVVRHTEVVADRCVYLTGIDCGSAATKPSFEGVLVSPMYGTTQTLQDMR